MISTREDDHVTTALELLTERFKDKAVIAGLLTACANRADEAETALWALLWGWVLEFVDPDDPEVVFSAEGDQLDDLGAIVGQPREGRTDTEYVDAIKLRVRINRSQGRSEDMVQIANLISELTTYVEYFPLGWEVSLYDIPNGGDLIRLLNQAKAAGSYGVLLTSNFDEDTVCKFDYAGEDVNVFGSAYSSTPEVLWPTALPTYPVYRRS